MNNARQIMCEFLVTTDPNSTLLEAYRLMTTQQIRHLPVLDPEGKLVGILSERDLERAKKAEGHCPLDRTYSFKTTEKVKDYMSWPVKTVSETASIRFVVNEILKNRISSFVVKDSLGKIKGIVTTDDLLKYLLMIIDLEQIQYEKPVLSVLSAG